MASFENLATLLESWKRIPQDFDFQLNKIKVLLQSAESQEDQNALIWLLSHNQRSRPVDLTFLVQVLLSHQPLPLWMLQQSFAVNADKCEVLAQLFHTKTETLSTAAMLRSFEKIKIKDKVEREQQIHEVWNQSGLMGRWLFNRYITGSYTCPLEENILSEALSHIFGVPSYHIKNQLQQLTTWDFDWKKWADSEFRQAPVLPIAIEISEIRLSEIEDGQDSMWDIISLPTNYTPGQLMVNSHELVLFTPDLKEVFRRPGHVSSTGETQFWQVFYDPASVITDADIELGYHPWFNPSDPSVRNPVDVALPNIDVVKWYVPPTQHFTLHELSNLDFQNDKRYYIRRQQSNNPSTEIYLLRPERFIANAMVLYVRRNTHDSRLWDEITFGMRHPEFPQLVPVARWRPAHDWLHFEEWKSSLKVLMGEKFGPVTTILPGWQVQISFDEIIKSKKHKSGFNIPKVDLVQWQANPSLEEIDDIRELFYNFQEMEKKFK